MRPRSSSPRAPRLVFKALTALMVAAAWAVLGYGLVYSRHDIAAWHELEAGGRFGMNFAVYVPYLALSIPIGAVAIIALFPRPDRMFPLAAVMALTGLFTVYMLYNTTLSVVQPDFPAYAFVAIGLNTISAIPLVIAHDLKVRGKFSS